MNATLEMLEQVTAALDTCVLHFGEQMTPSDIASRRALVMESEALISELQIPNVIIKKNGQVVSRSKNLRGVLRYRCVVSGVMIIETAEGALLHVHWKDGADCWARFASYAVACEFASKRRAWPTATLNPTGV